MSYPGDPYGDSQPDPSPEAPAKADPTEIDLEVLQDQRRRTKDGVLSDADVDNLIAAVEALRVRVADLTTERDLAVAHDRQPYPTAAAYETVCEARTKWQAHATDLAGALKWFDLHADSLAADLRSAHHSRGEGGSQWMADDDRELRADFRKAVEHARTTLAATPEKALARARTTISLLREHHNHHLQKGAIGLPDGRGGWIEIDNGAEYSDSGLYERTVEILDALDRSGTGDAI